MTSRAWRIVPSVFVLGLLVLVVRAQPPCNPPALVGFPATSSFTSTVPAPELVIHQPIDATYVVQFLSNLHAEIGPTSPDAVISLSVSYCCLPEVTPTADLVHRAVSGTATIAPLDFALTRPLVLRAVSGTAQSTTETAEIIIRINDPKRMPSLGYEPEAPVTVTAMRVMAGGLPMQVPGTNPVLAWRACSDAGADMADVYIVQQVLNNDAPPQVLFGEAELAQEFTVPVTSTVRWIEFISSSENGSPPADLDIEIFEVQNSYALEYDDHVRTMTATRLSAADQGSFDQARWIASEPFAFRPWLLPGRTYVVRIRLTPGDGTGQGVAFLGATNPDALPGMLHTRYTPSDPPFDVPADLAFRLIGSTGLDPRTPFVPTCTALTLHEGTPTATIAANRLAHVWVDAANRPPSSASHVLCDCVTATTQVFVVGNDAPVLEDTYVLSTRPTSQTVEAPWNSNTFSRPLVTRPVSGTVETNLPGIAFDFGAAVGSNVILGVGGPTETASGLFRNVSGVWEAVPATATAVICGAIEPDGTNGSSLYVLQQVLRVTDPPPGVPFVEIPTATADWVQYFTVPVTASAEWIEVAVGGSMDVQNLEVRLYDAASLGIPPPPIFEPTTTATFVPAVTTRTAQWAASERFTQPVALVPERAYAFVIDTQHAWTLGTRTTTETAEGFELFSRDNPLQPFAPQPDRMLSFRLIGKPAATPTDVVPIALPSIFGLRVGPNPAATHFTLAWKGGAGRTALDIADVRGRRVRRLPDAGWAHAGQWTWDGRDERGRLLPAGVYFIRVRDEGGRMATERVVLLR